jgi:Zn-dependent metalloprotease
MKYLVNIAVCLLCVVAFVNAQPAVYKLTINKQGALPLKRSNIKLITPVQAGILFRGYDLNIDDVPQWLQQKMEMRTGTDLLKKERPVTPASRNFEVNSFFQYYKGIKVEHGVVNITSRNGKVAAMQLEFYSIPDDFTIRPSLTEAAALEKARAAMQLPDTAYQQQQPPAGEVVIVRTYDNDSSVCLAWKFKILNTSKFAAAHVYVDAQSGRIVLQDNLIKHSNTPGQGDTRYSGRQTIVTDNSNPDTSRPYRLQQQRNGHNIITLNYKQKLWDPAKNDTAAVDFTDNDNNWDAIEHYNAQQDDAALDVHFNMQVISDYWKQVHNRNSWNNGNSPLRSFVHVNTTCGSTAIPLDNAFWYQSAMYFGDGSYGVSTSSSCFQRFRVLTPLDVTAHEVGHGITEATCRLLYRWESGALNEALSDIWGAVIEQWGIEQYASISAGKKGWVIGEEMTNVAGQGIRDMQNPRNFNQPATYNDNYWTPAAYPGCIPTDANDYCGVHQNSGVLNKWFYLITIGESGSNYFSQPYNVTGMGFLKSRELMYLTTLNLTPNASYSTAKAVTLDAAATLFGTGSAEVETVLSAWRAVGVDSAIWDMSNTPAFATANTQSFLSIGIGKNNTIWAGTDKRGLFVFDGNVWTQRSEINNVRINDIKDDKNGGIWVAQSGTTNSGMATAGGVNYFADPAAPMTGFYTVSTQTNVPTRNVRSIHIDKTRLNNGNPRVWIAANTYINSSGNSTSGKPAVGFNSGSPNFTGINQGIETSNNTGGVTAIGGSKDTIWTFAPLNFGKNQLIAYHAGTNALIAAFDNSTDPAIPANISVRAIYTDALRRTWFGLASNAVLVYDQYNVWHYVNFPAVFIAGSQVNSNAITGSPYGDVYIGTTAGLVFFDKAGPVNSPSSYQLYKKQNGLPSSNITGIAYDKNNFKVWLASDRGICRWDPLCLGFSCNENSGYAIKATSLASGNWSEASTWLDGIVPDSTMEVFIEHTITVDVNASCNSLTVLPGGATIVSPGRNLTIHRKKETVIQTGER